MAAKKEKVISFKGDEAEELVLSYLRSQNRPYGATDISANLKSKVSKLQAQKTLASLHEKGEILGKVYGKTTVYCAIQTEPDEVEPVDITTLETEVSTLKVEETKLKLEVKDLVQKRAELIREPATQDLNSTLAKIQSKCRSLESSLAPLRNTITTSPTSTPLTESISTTDLTTLNNTFNSTKMIALKRNKIGIEIQMTLMELFDKKKGEEFEIWELIGGDRDELIIEEEEKVWKEVKEVEEGEKKSKGGK